MEFIKQKNNNQVVIATHNTEVFYKEASPIVIKPSGSTFAVES